MRWCGRYKVRLCGSRGAVAGAGAGAVEKNYKGAGAGAGEVKKLHLGAGAGAGAVQFFRNS